MNHGKLMSTFSLFETPIQDACKTAGLVHPGGRGGTGRDTVSAHRFRHTLGTQLAERGAKLHTIMKVLRHTSVNMALVYAQISDQAVLRDYQAVLGPGATIAGPAADELRNGTLPDTSIDDPGGLFAFHEASSSSRRARWLVRVRSSGWPFHHALDVNGNPKLDLAHIS